MHPVTTGEKMVITACDGHLVDTNPRGCSCEGPTSWAETQTVSGYIPGHVVSKLCSVNLCHGSGSVRSNCQDGGRLDQTLSKEGGAAGVESVSLKGKASCSPCQ